MKSAPFLAALFFGAAFSLAPSWSPGQETKEELIRKLRGQAGAESSGDAPQIQARGLVTRGAAPGGAKPKTEKRSLYLSTRGIPKAVQAAAEEDEVELQATKAQASDGAGDHAVSAGEDAVELSYDVDPESKVTRDNIFFEKGSDRFADDSSLRVVVELAEALEDPSLSHLKYVIEGHASAEGGASANQRLSQRRAERIVSVLTSLGVSGARLLPVGFGETQARFPAHSREDLLRQDRRVVIFRLDH